MSVKERKVERDNNREERKEGDRKRMEGKERGEKIGKEGLKENRRRRRGN